MSVGEIINRLHILDGKLREVEAEGRLLEEQIRSGKNSI